MRRAWMPALILAAGCGGGDTSTPEGFVRAWFADYKVPQHELRMDHGLATAEWQLKIEEAKAGWLTDEARRLHDIEKQRESIEFARDNLTELKQIEIHVISVTEKGDDASVTYRTFTREPAPDGDDWKMTDVWSEPESVTLKKAGGAWKID